MEYFNSTISVEINPKIRPRFTTLPLGTRWHAAERRAAVRGLESEKIR
jgi:hypothetical protein